MRIEMFVERTKPFEANIHTGIDGIMTDGIHTRNFSGEVFTDSNSKIIGWSALAKLVEPHGHMSSCNLDPSLGQAPCRVYAEGYEYLFGDEAIFYPKPYLGYCGGGPGCIRAINFRKSGVWTSLVPIPATAWMFCSALFGLVISRKRGSNGNAEKSITVAHKKARPRLYDMRGILND
jgi:hypothetical protein